jgi:PAS domain-containing protein
MRKHRQKRPVSDNEAPAANEPAEAAQRAAILEQIVEGVILTDATGRITFVNEAARRLHGVAELGVPVERYTQAYQLRTMQGEPYPPEELPLARAVLRGETVADAEWRIERPDQTQIIAHNGTQLGAVLVLRDVTAQRELERQKHELLAAAPYARGGDGPWLPCRALAGPDDGGE